MKIEKSIQLFLNYCLSKQLRPKTMLSYKQALVLFKNWLKESEGIEDVEDIREITIRSYMLSLKQRGKYTVYADLRTRSANNPERRGDYKAALSNTTINNYLRNIRAYFNWLEESEVIQKSPMRKIKLLHQQRTPKEFLSDDEVKHLMRTFDRSLYSEYRDQMIVMIILDTGMRIGETLSIEMQQIDLFEMTIRLPADKTKGKKDRMVFFSRRTAKELRRWVSFKEKECDSEFVFPVMETGAMLSVGNFERNLRRYMQRTGIEKHISPHTLRNNFAKRCLMSGMDIYTLSRILGHSSVKITEKAYLDITDDDLKKRYAQFSPVDNLFMYN